VSLPTVFMFSGQGSQYHQMGRDLFESDAVFRESMNRLDLHARRLLGESVIDAIYSGSRDEAFDRTLMTHPAIFMVEHALAQSLIRGGLTPAMTLGSSLGSFAAAVVAGYLDAETALTIVVKQAIAFESCCEPGSMIAVHGNPRLCDEVLARRSELAGVNFIDVHGASHFAVSAIEPALDEIESALRERNVTHQRLPVSFAYHSRWIDAARSPFESFLQSGFKVLHGATGRLPLACCEQAAVLDSLPEDFFWRVVRGPIRFPETLKLLERSGPHRYIDVGPSGTLANFVKYGLPASSASIALPTMTPFGQARKNITVLFQQFASRPGLKIDTRIESASFEKE
jgi:bacillaene synthase trans-acting acyltransferase